MSIEGLFEFREFERAGVVGSRKLGGVGGVVNWCDSRRVGSVWCSGCWLGWKFDCFRDCGLGAGVDRVSCWLWLPEGCAVQSLSSIVMSGVKRFVSGTSTSGDHVTCFCVRLAVDHCTEDSMEAESGVDILLSVEAATRSSIWTIYAVFWSLSFEISFSNSENFSNAATVKAFIAPLMVSL